MRVKWNPKGIIALIAQAGIGIAISSSDPANPELAATASTIGSFVSTAISGLSIQSKKTPVDIYSETFENVLQEILNNSRFVINDRVEEIKKQIAELNFTDDEISEADINCANHKVREVLKNNDVYEENISDEIINGFIMAVKTKMREAVLNNESLLALDTNGRIVGSVLPELSDINEKLSVLDERFSDFLNKGSNIVDDRTEYKSAFEQSIKENKKYYIEKWTSRLFLHTRECDRPLTLENTFIFPEYKEKNLMLGMEVTKNNLDKVLIEFIEKMQNSSLLIVGTPGIGKTSIVSYIANRYKDDDNVIILKFRDLDEYIGDGEKQDAILRAVCAKLCCNKENLKNRLLILDGYDEIIQRNNNQQLFKNLLLDMRNIYGLKLIITSRENYIDFGEIQVKKILRLIPFSEEKIKAYYKLIKDRELSDNISLNNNEVLGIPVILYMALAVGIDIGSTESRSALYERIFALNGGIYDRFENYSNDAYDMGSHPVMYKKEMFHTLLQKLAFYMYEHDEKPVSRDVYYSMAKDLINAEDKIIFDFPIRNLYEGSHDIEFVHKSIYEYFTAEYIYQEIMKGIKYSSKEELAGILGKLFQTSTFTSEIKNYLLNKVSAGIIGNNIQIMFDVFDMMVKDGMTYYTKECHKNAILCEGRIFANMLELLHALNYKEIGKSLITLKNRIYEYLDCCKYASNGVNLRDTDLSECLLSGTYLSRTDLRGAYLYDTLLIDAELYDADLTGAHLDKADFTRANLCRANLSNTSLYGTGFYDSYLYNAVFIGANLDGVSFSGACIHGAVFDDSNIKYLELLIKNNSFNQIDTPIEYVNVYIRELDKIVTYEEYKKYYQV